MVKSTRPSILSLSLSLSTRAIPDFFWNFPKFHKKETIRKNKIIMSHQFTQNTPIRKFKEIRSHSHQIMKKTIHTHSSNSPKLKINNKNPYTFLRFFIPEQHLAIGSGQALSLSLSPHTHTHTHSIQ